MFGLVTGACSTAFRSVIRATLVTLISMAMYWAMLCVARAIVPTQVLDRFPLLSDVLHGPGTDELDEEDDVLAGGSSFSSALIVKHRPKLVPLARRLSSYERRILAACAITPDRITEQLDQIGGLEDAKRDLMTGVVMALQYPKTFFSGVSCMRPMQGITFVGAPGTGKSMLARAIARESGAMLLSVTLSAIEDKYFGESNRLLAACFSLARKLSPCVLFFDEIDGFMRTRNEDDHSASYGMKTEFLQHMDRLTTSGGGDVPRAVVVIGSTNNGSQLDPALRRRLPHVFHLKPPGAEERLTILRIIVAQQASDATRLSEEVVDMVRAADGLTGSDLKHAHRLAMALRMQESVQRDIVKGLLESGESDPQRIQAAVGEITSEQWREALQRVQEQKATVSSAAYCATTHRAGGERQVDQLLASILSGAMVKGAAS